MDEFKILTQRKKGEAHRETLVRLDWEGLTQEELKIMAKGLVCYTLQCQFRKSTGPIPNELNVKMKDMVHMEPVVVQKEFNLPKQENWMNKLLKGMSQTERNEIAAMLAGTEQGVFKI